MSTTTICVRRANSMEEAEIIVAWLAENGLHATIMDPGNPGVFAFGTTDMEGIAIHVADAAAAEQATKLLDEHDRAAADRLAKMGPISAVCEECGASNTFPAAYAGSVQECEKCTAYVDVPGAEEF